MQTHTIDATLLDWNELSEIEWQNLLIGNGFSINIWQNFSYQNLYDLAKSDDIDHKLSDGSIALFDHIESTNFEDALRIIYHAKIVDHHIGSPQITEIMSLYENIKNALGSAVNFAHIPPQMANTHKINEGFRGYRNIFTTNYDLIPYWSIMQTHTAQFKDYFWGKGSFFDPLNISVPKEKTKLYYLHGAIHLVELPSGATKKLTTRGLHRLSDLFNLHHPEQLPLFISEGSSEQKLMRIKRNDYLRFCYNSFKRSNNGLVVIGHSLHKDYDQHIIDAISESNSANIAIGIWPHQSITDIISIKLRLKTSLPEKNIYYYNSQSHPLITADLSVPNDTQ